MKTKFIERIQPFTLYGLLATIIGNRKSLPVIIFLALLVPQSAHVTAQERSAQQWSAFELMNLSVEPGERVSGNLPIHMGVDGIATSIPVTVLHGTQPGAVLALIAGIHGSEYAPILSMQRLPDLIDPALMSGTLIIVHIANLPAFQGRTIYFGPNDLKNLNRSFPGNANGTVTERIANTLTEEVMARADYLIDIHAGDANERLRPSYSAYYAEAGGDELIRESQRIAMAFGLETVVEFAGSYDNIEDAIYTSAQAVTRGIPAMDVESGELGRTDDVYTDPIVRGALNVLKELDMIAGDAKLPVNPLVIADRARIYSDHQGIWLVDELIETGDLVTEGTRLGVITDYFGKELQTISAPASGVLLILFETPPVNVGDNIVVIGEIPQRDD